MAEIKIAGIMRAGAYSPNHIGNDAAIFNAVADQLRKRGCIVTIYSEEKFINEGVKEDIIVNMCREMKSIHKLQKLEDEGALVINSGYGIENCTRERMTRILIGSNIPYPDSIMVNTDESVKELLKKSGFTQCWIKRGDFHAMHKEDVSYVRHPEEAQEVLQEYFLPASNAPSSTSISWATSSSSTECRTPRSSSGSTPSRQATRNTATKPSTANRRDLNSTRTSCATSATRPAKCST